jgi:hypothetical protein
MGNYKTKEHNEQVLKNKEKSRSRSIKNNYPIFKDGCFNIEDRAPWGFNYLLGYCEQPNNFKDN